MSAVRRVLFVTWDGPDQAYLESLFLPIFARLGGRGFRVDVLQYSWASADARARSAEACRAAGVGYTGRAAARRFGPLGVAATIAAGAREIGRLDYDVVMPRSILPAAMTLAAVLPSRTRVLFDADGLAADERLETAATTGVRPFYGAFRELERRALLASAAVITRTARAGEVLAARAGPGLDPARIHVIANGSDEQRFRPADAAERAATRVRLRVPSDAPWLVSAGSLGPQYLPELQLALFTAIAARRPDARFSVFTGRPEWVGARWRDALGDRLDVRRLAPSEVPAVLAAADVGIALREPSFSQRAVSPIKIAEYLLSGLPVIATEGVGDLDTLLGDSLAVHRVQPSAPDLDGAADWALALAGDARARARELGLAHFALSRCVDGYVRALTDALRD